ncbi:MAG: histidine phosphatase family protein, partial [bacterium]|nr:histidine phosphatase family protein [bacterium]
WNDLKRRTKDFLHGVERKFQGKRILVVGHGDPLWLLEGIIKGLDEVGLMRIYNKHYIRKGELKEIN